MDRAGYTSYLLKRANFRLAVAGQFMGALYVSHYRWVIFAFQVVAGLLLLVNRYVPLAVALLAPVIVTSLLSTP